MSVKRFMAVDCDRCGEKSEQLEVLPGDNLKWTRENLRDYLARRGWTSSNLGSDYCPNCSHAERRLAEWNRLVKEARS